MRDRLRFVRGVGAIMVLCFILGGCSGVICYLTRQDISENTVVEIKATNCRGVVHGEKMDDNKKYYLIQTIEWYLIEAGDGDKSKILFVCWPDRGYYEADEFRIISDGSEND